MTPIPIPKEDNNNIKKARELITQAGIEQALALDPKKEYSAKYIRQAINVLHNELDRLYDKV